MTIAMIGQKGLPARSGGIERHVSLLAAGLADLGHTVVVYGRAWYTQHVHPMHPRVEQRLTRGIHTKHLDAITHGLSALWRARSIRPDIIHIHGAGNALLLPLARALHPRAKLVVTFHCIDWEHAKWNWFARRAFRLGEWMMTHLSDRVIVVSDAMARYCVTEYVAQVSCISHAFTTDEVTFDAARMIAKHNLQTEKYFLFVGRLVVHKQPDLLMRAYAAACRLRPALLANLPLVIVGDGAWTDAYVRELQSLSRTIPGVIMMGELVGEELIAIQANALAHVFPTRSEGLSFTMLEAAAYGRPIIASDIAANREATGNHAKYMAVSDVRALTIALIEMLEMTPDERQNMCRALADHVATAYNFEARIRDIDQCYAELMGFAPCTTQVPLIALSSR